ncbi:MAG TPA: PLP-dependent transferase, partial [Steroidobacteraceae bacterium]|nr:PLP-dependent transferase [Steroidobacteraceae bacterium]
MDPVARQKAGLVDGLLRLSVGIEALEDLQADLAAGLERAAAVLPKGAAREPKEIAVAAYC